MRDCTEIRSLLSEYLDDALDAGAKALVDEHLPACPACREELDSLKRLVQGMGSLPSVKAPPDFLDQVHKRLERPSKISELWSRLFYPLRVKIPLQVAGAAVMAFLIFSILPMQETSIKRPSKPEQERKAQDKASSADESKDMKSVAASEALVQEPAAPAPKKEAREVALNLRRQVQPKAAGHEPSGAPAAAPPAALEMQRHKLAARAPTREDKEEDSLKKEPEPLVSVTKAIETAKGKVLSVDYNPQTGRPESVQAELSSQDLPILYEKLKELGDLQVSPETPAEKDSPVVHVKIRLIAFP